VHTWEKLESHYVCPGVSINSKMTWEHLSAENIKLVFDTNRSVTVIQQNKQKSKISSKQKNHKVHKEVVKYSSFKGKK
jgi:hypothetical protein